MTTKVTWSGNYASASVTPASATTTTSNTDSNGNLDVTVTNSAPVAGAVATITVTGYGYTAGTSRGPSAGSTIVTLTWAAPIATTLTAIDPVANVKVLTGSTNTITVSVKDQFGNSMSGEQLQPSLISGSANYVSTTTYPVITTGATGTATFTLTDALAVSGDSDVVSFASISNSSATPASFTIKYVSTLPAVASVTSYYNNSWGSSATTLIPSTGILGSGGASLVIENARNLTNGLLGSFSDATTDDMVNIRFRGVTSAGAGASGAAATLTAPAGGAIVNASGLGVATLTKALDSSGDASFQVYATAPGTLTFTGTVGTKAVSFTMYVAVPVKAAGRTVAISGGTTGTAFGDGVPMTVTVKDRYGNPVSGVSLTLSASGAGSFAGGATTQSFVTDSTGAYTFMAQSVVAAGGVGTFKASASDAGDSTSVAGYVGATAVDSTLAAGVASASANVTFAAGTDPAVASANAASDAALEAIDAANAATDAANLAAEAADAATMAAQDAKDAADAATAAVEKLAQDVAAMIDALKAQLTTLANVVSKIAKKVKA